MCNAAAAAENGLLSDKQGESSFENPIVIFQILKLRFHFQQPDTQPICTCARLFPVSEMRSGSLMKGYDRENNKGCFDLTENRTRKMLSRDREVPLFLCS